MPLVRLVFGLLTRTSVSPLPTSQQLPNDSQVGQRRLPLYASRIFALQSRICALRSSLTYFAQNLSLLLSLGPTCLLPFHSQHGSRWAQTQILAVRHTTRIRLNFCCIPRATGNTHLNSVEASLHAVQRTLAELLNGGLDVFHRHLSRHRERLPHAEG